MKTARINRAPPIFEYDGFTAVLTYSKAGQSVSDSEIVGDSGVLKIGSVSQYSDISLVKGGAETILSEMPARDEIMGDEAIKFADYIENGKEFYNDYRTVSSLTHNGPYLYGLNKAKREH